MPAPASPQPSTSVLGPVLRVMAPLVRWLVRSGVGYTEFTAALKAVFLDEARREARRTGARETDSALSLLSGLHRKDVRKAGVDSAAWAADEARTPVKASLPSQVVARWVAQGLPATLPLAGELAGAPSFETLVRGLSTDVHPRAVQTELIRLGVARLEREQLTLERMAFCPDPALQESHRLLAQGVADHLAAGVHNLTDGSARKYLEQAVFVDGLSTESVRQLEQLANQLWQDTMARMVRAAVPLCEHDEPRGGDQRLRLGLYCFAEGMSGPNQAPPTPQQQTTGVST